MAKKGISLNPGSDATLVAAATRAAMANVPKDLSGTFQAMSASYEKTMSTIGASFKQAAFNIGKMGANLANTAIYNQQNINKGYGYAVMEEKEILKVQAGDANELHVIASILQIQPREVTT